MSTINQYDRMNDPELGSGIYAQTSFVEQWCTALARLKELDPDWETWYDERPEQTTGKLLPLIEARIIWLEGAIETLERDERAGVDIDGFLLVMAVADCPPDTYRIADDPDRLGKAVALAYMEFPEPDWREKRKQEWQDWKARWIAANGDYLTPHGYRTIRPPLTDRGLQDDEFQCWHDDPGLY